MTGKCIFCKYLDENVKKRRKKKKNLADRKLVWVLKDCASFKTQFLHWRDGNQSRQIPLQNLPLFTLYISFSIHSFFFFLSFTCLKVPPVYRWLISVVLSHNTPLTPQLSRKPGAALGSMCDVFPLSVQV